MTNLTEFTFLSSDGKTRLHAMQWLPEGTPRAVLQISHGVAEHRPLRRLRPLPQ